MKIFKDKKIIPLINPNIDIQNPQELINMINDVPIISINNKGKEIVIGEVLGREKYIKDGFIYSDIMIWEKYVDKHTSKKCKKEYDYKNAEINCDENNNVTRINAIYYEKEK